MLDSFLLAGFGGQGVMFAGQLLAYAAMDAGLHVTWIPSYGPEMRGGTAHCNVVMSDKAIGSPLVRNPKVAVVFNIPSFDKYEPVVAPGGLLVVNSSLVQREINRTDLNVLHIPATDTAYKLGDAKLTNMILISAMLEAHPVISLDTLRHALEGHIPSHRRNLLDLNLKAIEAGETLARANMALINTDPHHDLLIV